MRGFIVKFTTEDKKVWVSEKDFTKIVKWMRLKDPEVHIEGTIPKPKEERSGLALRERRRNSTSHPIPYAVIRGLTKEQLQMKIRRGKKLRKAQTGVI